MKRPISLQLRLLLVNLLVLGLSTGSFSLLVYLYKDAAIPAKLDPEIKDRIHEPPIGPIVREFKAISRHSIWVAFSVSTLLTGLVSLWFARTILYPLNNLEKAVRKLNDGDPGARVPPSNIPEIHELGLIFNSMAAHLEDVGQRRRRLVSDLAHELGTPLTVLKGYLELMANNQVEATDEMAQQLLVEADRMTRLLQDLKLLANVEVGELPVRLRIFRPCEVIETVVSSLRETTPIPIEIQFQLPDRVKPVVFADPERMKQILLNLVGNAISYTIQGRILVRGWVGTDVFWVSVRDTGIGIDPDDLPHVFNRFWRSERSKQLRQEGSGIGLAIARHLVELQGGQIQVESSVGRGSTFRFSLPLASSSSSGSSSRSSAAWRILAGDSEDLAN